MFGKNEDSKNRRKSQLIFIACIVILIVVYLLITRNNTYMRYSFSEDDSVFQITYEGNESSVEPVVIEIGQIISVQLVQDMDVGEYVSGEDTKNVAFGIWESSELGEYFRCGEKDVADYILVTSEDGIVAFNNESNETTAALYESFREIVEEYQSGGAAPENQENQAQ